MTPQVLLLLENRATGGVTTISSTLAQALRRQGWDVAETVVRGGDPRALWKAAGGCDVILASHNFMPAYVGWLLALVARKPLVVWVHGPLLEVLAQAGASPLKRGALAWFYRRLSDCVFVSRASRESFDRVTERPPPQQGHHVVPNAVTQDTVPPTVSRQDTNPVELAYVGRLSPEKQPLLLLEALRLLPLRYRLTLVGDGPLRQEVLRSGADLLAGGRLTWLGHQPAGRALYRRWNLTLLASRYEGCPMSLLESLSFGVPCVALPVPAVCEVVGDDAPSLLAAGHSAQALADAIQRIGQVAPQEIGTQMSRVLQRHRLEDFAQRWASILRGAASRC